MKIKIFFSNIILKRFITFFGMGAGRGFSDFVLVAVVIGVFGLGLIGRDGGDVLLGIVDVGIRFIVGGETLDFCNDCLIVVLVLEGEGIVFTLFIRVVVVVCCGCL